MHIKRIKIYFLDNFFKKLKIQLIVYHHFNQTKRITFKNMHIKFIFYFAFYFDITKNIHRFAEPI